ncbi:MFS transporter [Aristophania vespae]|uniref:MFS transporter n=1 Tax=Aristophania vespae TaxID=2697033 RepID=UPI001F00B2A2|nr:MFS transporter [Aristophania vespae]
MPNMLPQDINHKRLLILTFILFICYLYVGISLSVTPLFVAHTLKLNNVWAGLSVGSAFLVTILTRGLAGSFSDQQGAKLSVSRGLCLYLLGATFSFCSGLVTNDPWLAYTILIVGRIVLGIGESFVMVGIIGWCIGFVGPERSGKAMALVGVAMYGALAIGGPLGIYLFNHVQFSGAMLISLILPSLGLMAIWPIPPVPAHPDLKRPSFFTIITQIWPYGTIVCLQGIGFAVIGAFFSLYFHANHWPHSGLGLTFFGVGFVLVRMLCGNLPDRIGVCL